MCSVMRVCSFSVFAQCLFVWIFLSVFLLSGFYSVFHFQLNFVCDFPQCFYFFCLEFFILPARGFNPRDLDPNSLTLGPDP